MRRPEQEQYLEDNLLNLPEDDPNKKEAFGITVYLPRIELRDMFALFIITGLMSLAIYLNLLLEIPDPSLTSLAYFCTTVWMAMFSLTIAGICHYLEQQKPALYLYSIFFVGNAAAATITWITKIQPVLP